jgi:hypothetical protein
MIRTKFVWMGLQNQKGTHQMWQKCMNFHWNSVKYAKNPINPAVIRGVSGSRWHFALSIRTKMYELAKKSHSPVPPQCMNFAKIWDFTLPTSVGGFLGPGAILSEGHSKVRRRSHIRIGFRMTRGSCWIWKINQVFTDTCDLNRKEVNSFTRGGKLSGWPTPDPDSERKILAWTSHPDLSFISGWTGHPEWKTLWMAEITHPKS